MDAPKFDKAQWKIELKAEKKRVKKAYGFVELDLGEFISDIMEACTGKKRYKSKAFGEPFSIIPLHSCFEVTIMECTKRFRRLYDASEWIYEKSVITDYPKTDRHHWAESTHAKYDSLDLIAYLDSKALDG